MFNLDNFVFEHDKYDLFEGMTSISAVIKSIVEGLSDRRIIAVLCSLDRVKQKSREIAFLKRNAEVMGFDVLEVSSDFIDKLTLGDTHGGIVAICTKRSFPSISVNNLTSTSFYALIDGIEDPYNFAYSIRSLYAAGVDGIILPQRNWMDYSGVVAR